MASYHFSQMLRTYLGAHTLRSLILDPAGVLALASAGAFSVAFYFRPAETIRWSLLNVSTAIGVSTAVLAILLTALAVVATLSNEDYLLFLDAKGIYNTIMLQFAYFALVSGTSIVAQFGLSLAGALGLSDGQVGPLALVAFGLLMWSVGGAVLTIRTLIRHSILRMKFVGAVGPK